MPTLTCPSPVDIKPLVGTGNYQFTVVRFPEVAFMVQNVELPTINLGHATMATAVNDIPIPGETMDFSPLTVTFVVDEKMTNYLAINDWMVAMGFPEKHQMYRDLMERTASRLSTNELAKGFTDSVLTILGNNNVPIMQAYFTDCFPITLSGLRFSSTNNDAEPITAEVTFLYSYYSMRTAT